MLQIALVPHEHDDDVRVGVVAELLEPARHIDVSRVLRDVVYEQCADCAAVVPAQSSSFNDFQGQWGDDEDSLRSGDGAVPFLTSYRPGE